MRRLSSLIFMGTECHGQKRSHKTQLLMSCKGNFLLSYSTSTLKTVKPHSERKSCFVGIYIQQSTYKRNRNEQGAFNHTSSLSHCSTTSFGCRTLFAMETLICATPTLQEVWSETRVQGDMETPLHIPISWKNRCLEEQRSGCFFRAEITEQNKWVLLPRLVKDTTTKLCCTDSGVCQIMHLLLQHKQEIQACKHNSL